MSLLRHPRFPGTPSGLPAIPRTAQGIETRSLLHPAGMLDEERWGMNHDRPGPQEVSQMT